VAVGLGAGVNPGKALIFSGFCHKVVFIKKIMGILGIVEKEREHQFAAAAGRVKQVK